MKFGLFAINTGLCSQPETAIRVAQAAEAAGFESVWTSEHVVLPDPQLPRDELLSYLDPKHEHIVLPDPQLPLLPPSDYPMLDPAVALAFIAAQTKTIGLGTGIIILPQRNPLVLAKALASLDVLSGGRLIFGLGIGWLKPEFDALGIPFEHRGPRSMEYLQAILAVWTQPKPAYQGRFVSFSGIQALPRPVQKPYPPIVIGGHTEHAFRRAVSHGNGWYGFALDLEGTEKCIAGLKEAQRVHGRPQELGELEISLAPSVQLNLDTVKRYADLGVYRLILLWQAATEAELLEFVHKTADFLIGRV